MPTEGSVDKTARGVRELTAEELAGITRIIPDDRLKERAIRGLNLARRIYLRKLGREVVGVVWVRRVCLIPNVTWITAPGHRGRGIAPELARMARRDFFLLTAMTRNEPSRRVARKSGYAEPIRHYWFWVRPFTLLRRGGGMSRR